MARWAERPLEVAHLFNPAFIALLLREVAIGHENAGKKPIDVSLTFIAIPLVLHGQTREAIPTSISTKQHVWLQDNPTVRVGLAERCKALVPHIKEATIFGCQHGLVQLSNDLALSAPKAKLSPISSHYDSEVVKCLKVAQFVGRWFARAGAPATIYSQWGLRP